MKETGWILLRGLGREQRHWGEFPERFAEATKARVFCIDLPGFGTEHARTSPATIAGIVDDLRRRFAPHRRDDRWSILGISLGGMTALEWCALHPDDFVRCVAVNSSARPSRSLERFRPAGLRAIARALVSGKVARERALLGVISNAPSATLDALAIEHARMRAERPPSGASLVAQVRAARAFVVPKLATPVLVLASTADRLVSHRCSERIAENLGAPLFLHDAGGHDLSLDEPAWISERVVAWNAS